MVNTRRNSAKPNSPEKLKPMNSRSPTGHSAESHSESTLQTTPQHQQPQSYANAARSPTSSIGASPCHSGGSPRDPISKAKSIYNYLVSDEDIAKCKLCDKSVTDKCKALTCDRCDGWWHKNCANLSEYEYDFYNNSPFPSGELQSKWICKICQEEQKPEVEPMAIMAKLVTKVEKLSTENCMFKKSLAAIMELLTGNKQEDKKVEETMQVTVAETMHTTVAEALDNCKEKEEKEKNVIFFNVAEAKEEPGMTEAEKKDYDHVAVNAIMQEAQKESFKPMMIKENVTRLGKRIPGRTRPRPIIVKLETTEQKWNLLKCAKNLKDSLVNSEVKIQRDKTKKELSEDRKLKAECEKMRQETKKEYVIFANQIFLRSEIPAFIEQRKKRQEEQRESRPQKA